MYFLIDQRFSLFIDRNQQKYHPSIENDEISIDFPARALLDLGPQTAWVAPLAPRLSHRQLLRWMGSMSTKLQPPRLPKVQKAPQLSSNSAAKWNVPILRVQVQVPYGCGSKPNNILSHQKHGCTARYPLPQFKSGSVEQSSSPQNECFQKSSFYQWKLAFFCGIIIIFFCIVPWHTPLLFQGLWKIKGGFGGFGGCGDLSLIPMSAMVKTSRTVGRLDYGHLIIQYTYLSIYIYCLHVIYIYIHMAIYIYDLYMYIQSTCVYIYTYVMYIYILFAWSPAMDIAPSYSLIGPRKPGGDSRINHLVQDVNPGWKSGSGTIQWGLSMGKGMIIYG